MTFRNKMSNSLIRISDIVAKHFQKDFKSKVENEVDTGGRGTTKSSKNAIKICLGLLEDKNADAIVFREDMAHHRNSTFQEIQLALERLGLEFGVDYSIKTSPLQIKLKQGNTIMFGYISDYNKIKGYKPTRGNYFKFVWFFEINEFTGGELHIEQAISTFARGYKPSFKVLYEFNTDENRNNWTNEWLEKVKKDDSYKVRFTTYKDLTEYEQQNWLGPAIMRRIDNLKKLNYKMYEFVYLGIPRVLQGACHPSFDRDKHVKKAWFAPSEMTVGIDFGVSDAVSAQLALYNGIEHVNFVNLYYHSNRKKTGDAEKTINDYAVEVYQKLKELSDKYQTLIEVSVDSANKVFIQLLKERALDNPYLNIKPVSKTKINKDTSTDLLQERIDLKNLLISSGAMSIDPENKELIAEIESSKYDKKTGKRMDNQAHTIDTIDASDYAIRDNVKYMIDFILEKGD